MISLLLVAAGLITTLSAEVYQWKDSKGNIMFGDSPPTGSNAKEKVLPQQNIDRPAGYAEVPGQNGTIKLDNKSLHDVNVIMYATSWCPYCKKARAFINALPGVRLTEYDIESSGTRNQEMLAKSGGSTGVPLIEVEGDIIKGYNPSAISAAVSKAQRR
jgi:glutaredoxin